VLSSKQRSVPGKVGVGVQVTVDQKPGSFDFIVMWSAERRCRPPRLSSNLTRPIGLTRRYRAVLRHSGKWVCDPRV